MASVAKGKKIAARGPTVKKRIFAEAESTSEVVIGHGQKRDNKHHDEETHPFGDD